jgi:hypothetical protein
MRSTATQIRAISLGDELRQMASAFRGADRASGANSRAHVSYQRLTKAFTQRKHYLDRSEKQELPEHDRAEFALAAYLWDREFRRIAPDAFNAAYAVAIDPDQPEGTRTANLQRCFDIARKRWSQEAPPANLKPFIADVVGKLYAIEMTRATGLAPQENLTYTGKPTKLDGLAFQRAREFATVGINGSKAGYAPAWALQEISVLYSDDEWSKLLEDSPIDPARLTPSEVERYRNGKMRFASNRSSKLGLLHEALSVAATKRHTQELTPKVADALQPQVDFAAAQLAAHAGIDGPDTKPEEKPKDLAYSFDPLIPEIAKFLPDVKL